MYRKKAIKQRYDDMKADMLETEFNLVEKTNYFAMKLFPYASKHNARRLLTRFCTVNKELHDKLTESGWHTLQNSLTLGRVKTGSKLCRAGAIYAKGRMKRSVRRAQTELARCLPSVIDLSKCNEII